MSQLDTSLHTSNNSMHVIIIPPVDMLPKGMLTYSYNTCQLVPSSMLTCMSPTTCMSTLLHMSTYSLTMLTCSIKYVNMLKQVCQHAFHSQHACQEFSTCQHTAPFPDASSRLLQVASDQCPADSDLGGRVSQPETFFALHLPR